MIKLGFRYIKVMALAGVMAICALPAAAAGDAPVGAAKPGFARGADVGWLTELESQGHTFHNRQGETKELMQLLRDDCDVDAIRLRVWVNPDKPWNAIPDVVAKARRAADLGLRLMIDFHFSDTWADPGHQVMPRAWEGLPAEAVADSVAAHVTECMTALRDAGVTPEWVQIGNETTPGMMLPLGSVTENPQNLVLFNNAGYDAVKAVFPEAICIVHLDNGYDRSIYDRMFSMFNTAGARYDMIGMSLYPWWAEVSGREGGMEAIVSGCIENIGHVKETYGRPVMICEIGMPWDKAEECRELIARMMDTDVEGIFYWEPEAPNGYNDGYNMGCFADGAPTVALDAFVQASPRSERTLTTGWEFTKRADGAADNWQNVRIPHDWAIYGPFDRANDLQTVAVWQNGETEETVKTGRTGALPFIGKGSYRTTFELADTAGRSNVLVFDGAMSNAHVRVNGTEVAYWPFGYNAFIAPLDGVAVPGQNILEVDLENYNKASRWYPGAGLYRNVHLVSTSRVHIPVWGTYVTTPEVTAAHATVKLQMEIEGAAKGQKVHVSTSIYDPEGRSIATRSGEYLAHGQTYTQNFALSDPQLWSPDSPQLYSAVTTLSVDGKPADVYTTRFGIRKLEYIPEKGFFLNGQPTKFRGVNNHHDLGPLGAAINRSVLRHRLELLKDMGANAVRTSHNMPSPELVDLCDELGIMLMVEPFDDWSFRPKSENGYGRFFTEWAERDITNMVRHYRNNPSVVMWSIGNEVPSQWGPDGVEELTMLQDLVHSLDPTRPVTCGMDQIGAVLDNGFAAALDIPGFNYKPQYYDKAHSMLPQGLILGTETASTVSSRGVYHFPVSFGTGDHNTVLHADHQSNSYDTETCDWSNRPDIDFFMDDKPWVLGQFVWTGYDYLGEPSPYDTDAWPNHSSVFGIIDLASLPKDRFYLYRSVWNTEDSTLHVLPHWTWPGREGEVTPVFVYTSYPEAELFINGRSQGRQAKNDSTMESRYRLMWMDAVYEPGEIRVVAYDADGQPAAEKTVRTAGRPHHLVLTAHRDSLQADGEDMVLVTVQVADKDGNIVPTASNRVRFATSGAGSYEAAANGDPTCLLPFQNPEMDLFSGAATAILRAGTEPGTLTLKATSRGLKPATVTIPVR